jgi:hypothetical protein
MNKQLIIANDVRLDFNLAALELFRGGQTGLLCTASDIEVQGLESYLNRLCRQANVHHQVRYDLIYSLHTFIEEMKSMQEDFRWDKFESSLQAMNEFRELLASAFGGEVSDWLR